MKKNIEVELRSLIDERKFFDLKFFLAENGKDLGEDNKDTYFFLFSDKLFKITNNITKNNAKITLKLQKIGLGSDFEEIEVQFPCEDVEKVIRIFGILGFKDYQYSYQSRNNYLYKNIEFAIKYTVSWGFHCEMEIMVNSKDCVPEAIKQMTLVASELGLKIISDKELKELTGKIDAGWKRGQYSREDFEKI